MFRKAIALYSERRKKHINTNYTEGCPRSSQMVHYTNKSPLRRYIMSFYKKFRILSYETISFGLLN